MIILKKPSAYIYTLGYSNNIRICLENKFSFFFAFTKFKYVSSLNNLF